MNQISKTLVFWDFETMPVPKDISVNEILINLEYLLKIQGETLDKNEVSAIVNNCEDVLKYEFDNNLCFYSSDNNKVNSINKMILYKMKCYTSLVIVIISNDEYLLNDLYDDHDIILIHDYVNLPIFKNNIIKCIEWDEFMNVKEELVDR
jgi:hypothetical protein